MEVATLPDAGGAAAPRSVYAASLNGIEKTRACVQNGSYQLARFLWLNTMLGFRVTPGGVTGEELELAKCYSGTGLVGTTITSLVTASNIDAIPIGCKSFDETTASSGCTGPAPATNSCANNPGGVASKLAINETCTAASECASDACTAGKCSF